MHSFGIINGISTTAFAPNKSLTRAELAKMIVYTRGLQSYADEMDFAPAFSDVSSNHWAKNYIHVAVDQGILKGYDDGTFKPEKEVTYAETIAIVLRILGYVNIDETSQENWYTGYTKRMYEIGLDKGVPIYSSYTAPAKRGDVAVLWWNMLVSDKWAVTAQSTVNGFYYTYSSRTQLDTLFPDFDYVTGRVTSISNGISASGDYIEVCINGKWYQTESDVPIYSLGATGTGVYDQKSKKLYGFSIDDEYSNYKVLAGPIFYLEEQGYKAKNVSRSATYGSKNNATFAYILVSETDNSILRAVYVDASDSCVVESVKIEYEKDNKNRDEDEDDQLTEDEDREKFGYIYLNKSEDAYTNTDSVVIVNGKKIEWKNIPKGAILTTLIPNRLYTYETQVIEPNNVNFDNLKELYFDEDKYIVASNCIYTIDGKYTNDKDEKLIEYNYNSKMKKDEFRELSARDMKVHINIAEEVVWIEFGKYNSKNVVDKYDNSEYVIMYVQSISYKPNDKDITVKGLNTALEKVSYTVPDNSDPCTVGDLIILLNVSNGTAEKYTLINRNNTFGNDISIVFDVKEEYYNDAFGEYVITKDTMVLEVIKEYEENSNNDIKGLTINRFKSVDDIKDLSKYKVILLINNKMNIDVVYLERELNKTTYPVARISEIRKINTEKETPAGYLPVVEARFSVVGDLTRRYEIISGDCEVGELVTFELKDDNVTIKERFKTKFIGHQTDVVIKSFNSKTLTGELENSNDTLNLNSNTLEYNGKTYDLLEYKYLFATVKQDSKTGEWGFINAKFQAKEELKLEAGDRIAFGELNGIAVVYRGYSE